MLTNVSTEAELLRAVLLDSPGDHKIAAPTRQLDGFSCYSAPPLRAGLSLWFGRHRRASMTRGVPARVDAAPERARCSGKG